MTLAEMNPAQIESALNKLMGLPWGSFGRAANLIWFGFGDSIEISSFRGGTRWVHAWTLHLQCAWRLCLGSRIEVADQDCYRNFQGEYLEDWDKPGKSRFDDYAAAFRSRAEDEPIVVETVSVDDVGGFSLAFTNGLRLDVFPNNAGGEEAEEHWRLFEYGNDNPHFVVFENPDERGLALGGHDP